MRFEPERAGKLQHISSQGRSIKPLRRRNDGGRGGDRDTAERELVAHFTR
jgi:hypothetical protein